MRRLPVLAVAALLPLLAACDGGDEGDDTAAATTAAPTTPSTTPPTTGPEPVEVEYPGGGPVDRVFPPGDPAYQLLAAGDCTTLQSAADAWVGNEQIVETEGADTIPLYQAAALACRGRFDEAATALGQLASPPVFNRNPCSRQVVLDWVTQLVEASQADPAYAPTLVASDDANPCPEDEAE